MPDNLIVDVTEEDFELEVLTFSQNIPVLVDFWAEWCQPCKTLTPLLERITLERKGAFRLAKLNVDTSKPVSIRYGVRTIPTVKAFIHGQVTGEFTGLQPEERIREFLRTIAPSPADLSVEKGLALLRLHQWPEAETVFEEVLALDEGNTRGRLGLLTSLVGQGKAVQAANLIDSFPASHEYSSAQNFLPLVQAYLQAEASAPEGTELDAAFRTSVLLAKRGNIQASLDGLLDILRRNKRYANGAAREVAVSLLQLLGEEDNDARQYRTELASILF